MSRIGKRPILLPEKVTINTERSKIRIEGPRGVLSTSLPSGIEVVADQGSLVVKKTASGRKEASYHGMVRTLIANMVTGVSKGFEKTLEISGVGYRAEKTGGTLRLLLGYSHPVEYTIPQGIDIRVDKQVIVVISGIDKQLVGKVAAEIRDLKKPEPYKGKGVKYSGEKVRRKVGKSVGS